ncbi:hypothetical protein TRFO_17413 [Tritrichomonas foetus]|uniref:Ras-GAP domain-containing protein n=1 Tax=Tritrichomonas foetus TaxID=1144522 RepID=A0A1J4KP48_9EUKA|nr:hypothetical protein TRFO_17413 [Tritrichomonas foetus]|eukprot:OHT12696.1 hypothetical protein TRFO_17413 [Tritrichomonas foetus]
MSLDTIEPMEFLATTITPSTVTAATSPHAFFKLIGPSFHDAIKEVKNYDINTLFHKLCLYNPSIDSKCPPFIIVKAKTSRSKRTFLSFFLFCYQQGLIEYDQIHGKEYISSFALSNVVKKDDKAIRLYYVDGSISKLYFDYEINVEMLCNMINLILHQENIQPLSIFVNSLQFLQTKLPNDFESLNELLIKMIIQPDYFLIRSLFSMPVDAASKRKLAVSIVKIHSFNKSLCFYLNVIASFYFINAPPPQELLRSDSLLTNSLAAVRDLFAPKFFQMFADDLHRNSLKQVTEEDIITQFLTITSSLCIPTILRWLCWMIYHEAKRVMPEGDGPYYAVSGFFFLRGLGPLLTQIEDPVAKKKCILITSLINFSNKPSIQQFIPKFKDLLQQISLYVEDTNIVPDLPKEELQHACNDIVELFTDKNTQIRKYISENTPIGKHPIHWFLERQMEEILKM